MTGQAGDHGHPHAVGHGHDHRGEDHRHRGGVAGFVGSLVRPHSHDYADAFDDALTTSRTGTRALAVSTTGLLVTAGLQAVVVARSGSVGLLADVVHNAADACTALPIGLAFLVSRRPPTSRYTYGYGRAEDLAGLAVVVVMAVSAGVAAWAAVARLLHPHHVGNLGWVAVAGLIGLAGNELAAWYRIRVGRQIGSAALVADGHHARTDGFTSLAVVLGAAGVALGWPQADPVVGLLITVAILAVLRSAVREVGGRLMDAVDPTLVEQATHAVTTVAGITGVRELHIRWVGHTLRAEVDATVGDGLTVTQAHDLAHRAESHLLHQVRRLTAATVHTSPTGAHP